MIFADLDFVLLIKKMQISQKKYGILKRPAHQSDIAQSIRLKKVKCISLNVQKLIFCLPRGIEVDPKSREIRQKGMEF